MTEARSLPTEDDLNAIRESVRAVVSKFGDDYWAARDDDGEFSRAFHRAMADAAACCEQRKAHAAPNSSGRPKRRAGLDFRISSGTSET